MSRRAFTLIELLVAVSIIALLIAVLLPALSHARRSAQSVACVSNVRQLETAHWAYMADHKGRMLGTSHGESWINILHKQYDPMLLMRSPLDTSPYFDQPEPTSGLYRQTSYSLNLYLSPDGVSHGMANAVGQLDNVPNPSATIHSTIGAYQTPSATRDHFHPNAWGRLGPTRAPDFASAEIQTNAHGGDLGQPNAYSAYGYIDGHAEIQPFEAIYASEDQNQFNPDAAQ